MEDRTNKRSTFLLIDGNAILHRAYHALPSLTTKDGTPTGAVFGFFSMLLKVLQEVKPAYLAITFDRPKPTFRQQLFVGYQAHRPKMSDELGQQIKIVHHILENANIAIFEVDGFEADDVIGTIALKAQNAKRKTQNKEHFEVIILSGDRDMLQLVNSHVKVLAPIIGITKMVLYDEALVKEKFGVASSQIIDYKALMGDVSDNYSGVLGVGPKTAGALIAQFKTVENIYMRISELEKDDPKLAKKLAEQQEEALLAKKLATIVTDVPLVFDKDACFVPRINQDAMRQQFSQYGFNSLLKRLDSVFPAKNSQPELLN